MSDARLSTPIASAVAYPFHCLWVPWELWIVNATLSSVVGVAIGFADGTGVRTELTAVMAIVTHLVFARAFRRNRHVVQVWRARFDPTAPMGPRSQLPKLLPSDRHVIRLDP